MTTLRWCDVLTVINGTRKVLSSKHLHWHLKCLHIKMELYCCFERNFKHSVVFDRCKNEIFKLVCSWLHHRKWSRMELFSGFIFIKSHEKQKQKNSNVLPFMAKADHKYMLVFLNKSTKWNYSLQLFREIIQTAICWKLF